MSLIVMESIWPRHSKLYTFSSLVVVEQLMKCSHSDSLMSWHIYILYHRFVAIAVYLKLYGCEEALDVTTSRDNNNLLFHHLQLQNIILDENASLINKQATKNLDKSLWSLNIIFLAYWLDFSYMCEWHSKYSVFSYYIHWCGCLFRRAVI